MVLALHAPVLVLLGLFTAFNPDEFEHIHITWNMKEGRLIFRDFFDNHGPLFSILHAPLWWLLGLPDDGRTLAAFRVFGLVWPALAAFLTWKIAVRSLGQRFGLVSVAVLFSSLIFLRNGVEVRPDGLQVVCWLACVLFLLRALQGGRGRDAFASGAFLGLALLANAKMVTAVVALVSWGTVELWRSRRRPLPILALALRLGAGVLAALVPLLFYFTVRDGLWELQFYTLPFNMMAVAEIQSSHLITALPDFLRTHFFILFAAFAGARRLRRSEEIPEQTARVRSCLLVLTTVTGGFALLGFVTQYYLVFLPLLAVLASFYLVDGLPRGRLRLALIATLLLVQIAVVLASASALVITPFRRMQLDILALVLEHTREDEPVVLTGADQGGYVFRPDLQYYWTNGDNLQRIFDRVEGHRVFGERFVERLEAAKPTFIISLDTAWARHFLDSEEALAASGLTVASYPEPTRRYVAEHYVELPGLHLLARRTRLTPALREDVRRLQRRFPQSDFLKPRKGISEAVAESLGGSEDRLSVGQALRMVVRGLLAKLGWKQAPPPPAPPDEP